MSAIGRWRWASLLGLLFVFGIEMLLQPAMALAAAHGEGAVGGHSFHNSKAVAFVFWFFALGTIAGAIFVITRRNLVTAVMAMVGTFFCIGGLYLMLYASFLAVMQVLVYAGAIMVLFVFVIMILNRPVDEPWALRGLLGKGLAALGLLYVFSRLAEILWQVKDHQALELARDKLDTQVLLNYAQSGQTASGAEAIQRVYEFGSIQGVGHTLFTKYIFPFEAVSILFLVAVVGAIVIARPSETTTTEEG